MGIIDQTKHSFKCLCCGATDILQILQRGSSWGASWSEPPNSKKFTIAWENDRFGEPQPVEILCMECNIPAYEEK